MKLFGENTSNVIKRLEQKFPEVQASLPEGVTLVPYYNQRRLVENATGTVKTALLEGAVLVTITLLLFGQCEDLIYCLNGPPIMRYGLSDFHEDSRIIS
jgi:Cu/Ag efflux pump CusA